MRTLTDLQLANHTRHTLLSGQPVGWVEVECDRRDRYTPPPPTKSVPMLAAALWYAAQDLTVFPCRAGSKLPATPHGFKDATTDEGRIRAWWADMPAANIGVATGGLADVVDCDSWEGADAFADIGEPPPLLGVSITPRGRHYWIPATGRGCSTRLRPGLDWRGTGGYAVAPPSATSDGSYYWAVPLTLNKENL